MDSLVVGKVKKFFSTYRQQYFEKGYILIYAEHEPTGIFYIEKGQVRQYDISNQGEEVVVNVFKPGAFFPMNWAINDSPNQYFFDAGSEITIRLAPAKEVVEFLRANPDVVFDLLSRVYSGVDGLLRRMAHLMGGSARTKLLHELLIECRRFGTLQPDKSYTLKISESELAKRCGLSRETVSRELAKLKKLKLVNLERRGFVINNLIGLEEELGNTL